MVKAQAASTSSHKSSSPAAALVRSRNTLTFRLHPKQLVAFRSKATEIPYRGAAGGGKPLTGTRSSGRHATLGQPRFSTAAGRTRYRQPCAVLHDQAHG